MMDWLNLRHVQWVWPWVWLALPLPLLVLYLRPPRHRSNGVRLRLPDAALFGHLSLQGHAHSGNRKLAVLLLTLSWLALLMATARPQYLGPLQGLPQTGRDLLLAIDVSNSMRQNDFILAGRSVSRMAVVKRVASDFVARRQGDRVGLVLFGTAAFVQTPLTRDHRSVQHFLQEAETGLAGQSTAIGDAIGLAVKRLRERPAKSRVIVLLTDGSNTAGQLDPVRAAQLAADENIRIYTIGIGGHHALFGNWAPTGGGVDEALLQQIASLTDGRFFRAGDREELEEIYQTIDAIEPVNLDEKTMRPRVELYHWPLAVALLCSCLWAVCCVMGTSSGERGLNDWSRRMLRRRETGPS